MVFSDAVMMTSGVYQSSAIAERHATSAGQMVLAVGVRRSTRAATLERSVLFILIRTIGFAPSLKDIQSRRWM